MKITCDNRDFRKHIFYVFRELQRRIDLAEDKDLAVHYGQEPPQGYKGVFIRESSFWKNYKNKNSLPKKVFIEPELAVLYGTKESPDIIAGAFLMLSRYEELFDAFRDEHKRFPARRSLAYKYGFLDRPIVDEYAEWFYQELKKAYPNVNRKKATPRFIFTHDVDKFKKPRKEAVWTELKNILRFRLSGIPGVLYHLINPRNPADTFDWLADLEKGQGIFFFMNKSEDGVDYSSPGVQALVNKLKNSAGYEIGLHPDKNEKLQKGFSLARNHFLLFEVGQTWEAMEKAGIKADYSLAYAERLGFRAGTCHPFQCFSLAREQELQIMEYPLTLMDVTLYGYLRLGPHKAWREFLKYLNIINRYNGTFILLWHNFAFDEWRWRKFYRNMVNYVKALEQRGLIKIGKL